LRAEPVQTQLSPPKDDPGDPALVGLIRAEIERDGPITFARFMERALYEPGLGYYATSAARPTRAGDFLTAPELHPVFGHALARQLDEMWRRMGRPEPFVVREYGAGTGTLFLALLDGLLRIDSGLAGAISYQPIEIEGRLPQAEHRREPFAGCVVANEFLDALPVHRVVQQVDGAHELLVDWRDGRFVEEAGGRAAPRVASWFVDRDIQLEPGQRAEVNLAMTDWLAEVGHDLEAGYVLVIDYGLPPAELYGAARQTGTLRAFSAQHVSSDVLGGVGRRDLTAHVDLDAFERAARGAGLEVLGRTRQAEFLLGCGLEEAYADARADADADWQPAIDLRAAVRRLLDPRALGGYAVVVLGCGVEREPPLRGLAFAAPARG
jgi:SAM-dependent MidA family methyltransferase